MSKATSRPWEAIGRYVCEKDGLAIADCGSFTKNIEKSKANAELIVRAVNCHEELVEALEQHLKDYSKEQWNQVGGDEYQIKLEDLLKRAKGE